MKNVTNPWGAQVGYDYDKAGRLQNVSGSGYAGVSNYASSLSYRAFGAIKGMSYGDGRTLSTGYDNRLRPTTWNVSGVLGYNYTYNDTYMHESTGRVTYAQNINDSTLDRSYEYDHAGRLAISHTGAEARAAAWTGQWGTMDGPYSQGYDYDVWGNVTHKYGWGGEVQGGSAGQSSDITYSYTGNRRNGFGYDAAGNLTNDGTQSFAYDATGQQTYASGIGAGGSAPTFTDDPLVSQATVIKLEHLTELRTAVNQLRARAGLATATWSPDPDPQRNVTTVKADHIRRLRTKLEEALNALHLAIGGYAHPTLTEQTSLIYAIDFQELRNKIKDAWTALASSSALSQSYDGNGLRVKKAEYGWTTWYLRSSVLGGQVIAEIDGNAVWQRGYVYAGGNLMAVQQGGVFWMHEDPVTKSKRTTDVNGNVVSAVELDPWGADTNRSSIGAFQPRKYTTYDRDGNGSDEAMFRRYNRKNSRFDQPDPYEGSYDVEKPQSFNRYAYTLNDPVNFTDPTGLEAPTCMLDGMPISCSTAGMFVSAGAGVRGPLNTTRWNANSDRMGNGGFDTFRAVGPYVGWFDMHGVLITTNAYINGELVGTASSFQSFGSRDFGGNPLMGSFDQWPPQWPIDRTFGWRTKPTGPPKVTLPGGEPIRMTPQRGVPRIGVDPDYLNQPRVNPGNPRIPANLSVWQKIGFWIGAGARVIGQVGGRITVIMTGPSFLLDPCLSNGGVGPGCRRGPPL